VNRNIVYGDGMRVVEQTKLAPATHSDGILFTELDRYNVVFIYALVELDGIFSLSLIIHCG
jgi:hypothetical protein